MPLPSEAFFAACGGLGASSGGSFFVVGGTLGRDVPCYVRRKADEDIYNALRRNEFCYVLTSGRWANPR